jgi:P27 family predicted phage terminase small subunit
MRGTDRADRRNGNEPEPDLLDDLAPPAHLSPRSAAVWDELAPMLRKMGVLTVADKLALEMLCDCAADYRLAREQAEGQKFVAYSSKGSQMLNQLHVAQQMFRKGALDLMGRFAMDPAARSRVMIDPQGDLFGDKPPADTNGPGRFFDQPTKH